MPAVNKPIDLKPVEAQAANMSAPSMVAAASAQTPTSAPASAAAYMRRGPIDVGTAGGHRRRG